jgi:hypothetical protein
MSHWGYVIESLLSEDREAAERRIRTRRRRKWEREQAALAAAAAALPERLEATSAKQVAPAKAVSYRRADQRP